MIKIIAAVSKNGIIGVDNKIPWDYPEDMKFFRAMTANSVVIMGRKTFESIGRPLPKRRNIVISRIAKGLGILKDVEGIEVAASLKNALDLCDAFDEDDGESRDIWLIGGASIYEEGLEFAEEIYLTLIPKWIDVSSRGKDFYAKFPWINPHEFSINTTESQKLSEELTIIKYVKS